MKKLILLIIGCVMAATASGQVMFPIGNGASHSEAPFYLLDQSAVNHSFMIKGSFRFVIENPDTSGCS